MINSTGEYEVLNRIGTRLHANARAHLDVIESFKTRLREILEAPLSMYAEAGPVRHAYQSTGAIGARLRHGRTRTIAGCGSGPHGGNGV